MPANLIDLELAFRGTPTRPTVAVCMRDQRSADLKELATVTLAMDLAALLALSNEPLAYGQALGAMLFAAAPLRDAWLRVSGYAAGASDTAMRLRLRFEQGTEALQAIRWECLCDPDGRPVIAEGRVLLLRYVPSADLRRVRAATRDRLRVIAAIASPQNSADYGLLPFDAAAEAARMQAALGDLPNIQLFAPGSPSGHATPENLIDALQRGCDLLYLVCHGALVDGAPVLWLEDAQGQAVPLGGDAITRVISSLPTELRPLLVIIGACHSAGRNDPAEIVGALAPQLARDGVPAVLAMQGYAPANLIERYLPAFLTELFRSGRIDQAAAMARLTIPLADAWLPALYLRSQDGLLWSEAGVAIPEEPQPPAPPPPPLPLLTRPLTITLLTGSGADGSIETLRRQLILRGLATRHEDEDDDQPPGESLAGAAAALLLLAPERLDDDTLTEDLRGLALRRQADPDFSVYALLDGISESVARRAGVDLKALAAVVLNPHSEPAALARRMLKRVIERYATRVSPDGLIDIGLFTFPPSGPGAEAALRLDWRALYLNDTYPSPDQWREQLRPALNDLYEVLRGKISTIRLHVSARIGAALAFGHQFRSVSEIRLRIPQRDGEWQTLDYDGELRPLVERLPIELDPNGSDISVELPLTQDRVVADVQRWIESERPPLRRRLILEPPDRATFRLDAASAHAIACQVRRVILDQRKEPGLSGGTIHLFGAIPAALGALIGWHLNTCEPVQWYELEGNSVLRPACLLRR